MDSHTATPNSVSERKLSRICTPYFSHLDSVLTIWDGISSISLCSVCAPDADIAFLSSDNVLFRLRRTHLNSNSTVLSVPDGAHIDSEPAVLAEPADVLEILFQFIEPPPESREHRQPLVAALPEELFFCVAEAAEKYVVHGAMNVCYTYMMAIVTREPLHVLNHCVKHGYSDLSDQAAEDSLSRSFETVASILSPDVLRRWMIYYSQWRELATSASYIFADNIPADSACHVWPHLLVSYLRQIDKNPRSVAQLPPDIGKVIPCSIFNCTCRSKYGDKEPWVEAICEMYIEMPTFSEIK